MVRGKWLLNNIFGLPIPPPPPGLNTSLPEQPGKLPPTMRERLAQHRTNPSCNSCHSVIDPLGFALENYDVIGGWRTIDEADKPVDASGTTAAGEKIDGLPGLRRLLLEQPDSFPRTVTEKLMAYALGRRLEYYDEPTVRRIVREAAAGGYRWSSIVTGIVNSPAFLMRDALPTRNRRRRLPVNGRIQETTGNGFPLKIATATNVAERPWNNPGPSVPRCDAAADARRR